jgi:hypothetical protein
MPQSQVLKEQVEAIGETSLDASAPVTKAPEYGGHTTQRTAVITGPILADGVLAPHRVPATVNPVRSTANLALGYVPPFACPYRPYVCRGRLVTVLRDWAAQGRVNRAVDDVDKIARLELIPSYGMVVYQFITAECSNACRKETLLLLEDCSLPGLHCFQRESMLGYRERLLGRVDIRYTVLRYGTAG